MFIGVLLQLSERVNTEQLAIKLPLKLFQSKKKYIEKVLPLR
jgi:hypothetical protein